MTPILLKKRGHTKSSKLYNFNSLEYEKRRRSSKQYDWNSLKYVKTMKK